MKELLRMMVLSAVSVGACSPTANLDGDTPLNTAGYSGPVSIRVDKFKDDEVRNGVFDEDKNVNTETGNPYGAFLQDARTRLGRAPAAVLVDRATVGLGPDSRGVLGLHEIFAGPLTLYLATSAVRVDVGTVAAPTGSAQQEVTVTATRATLAPIQPQLVDGGFKVGVSVPAAPGRPASFDVKVTTVLYFRALIS